jgi:hypothetical protein
MIGLINTTEKHIQARWILQALEHAAKWAKMSFEPRKSRYLIVDNGGTTKHFRLRIHGKEIPSVTGCPFKCLGKRFDVTLYERKKVARFVQQLNERTRNIDRTNLPGNSKLPTWTSYKAALDSDTL